jgi:hypothetical protein
MVISKVKKCTIIPHQWEHKSQKKTAKKKKKNNYQNMRNGNGREKH